jgi:hypothetical protein
MRGQKNTHAKEDQIELTLEQARSLFAQTWVVFAPAAFLIIGVVIGHNCKKK